MSEIPLVARKAPSGRTLRAVLSHDPMTNADYEEGVDVFRRSGAIEKTEAQAHEFAARAKAELEIFEPSEAHQTLERVCDYVVDRRS